MYEEHMTNRERFTTQVMVLDSPRVKMGVVR